MRYEDVCVRRGGLCLHSDSEVQDRRSAAVITIKLTVSCVVAGTAVINCIVPNGTMSGGITK